MKYLEKLHPSAISKAISHKSQNTLSHVRPVALQQARMAQSPTRFPGIGLQLYSKHLYHFYLKCNALF